MSRDRRTEIRIRSVNLISYSRHAAPTDPSEPTAYEILGTAATRDLSATGCRLATTQPIPAGTVLRLCLQLGDHVVDCQAEVVRVTKDQGEWSLGLEFRELDDLASDGIRAYLSFKEGAQEA
ncbi:MAG: PilZ domain-containing protein [Planctomycetes bacterium]|nr:PilZ domain-containing protein [Planctomycetota bacterium]